MAKPKETNFSHITKPRVETALDKTTRIVREMLDTETENREVRTSRLRKARLEREAATSEVAPPKAPSRARKTPQTKTATP